MNALGPMKLYEPALEPPSTNHASAPSIRVSNAMSQKAPAAQVGRCSSTVHGRTGSMKFRPNSTCFPSFQGLMHKKKSSGFSFPNFPS